MLKFKKVNLDMIIGWTNLFFGDSNNNAFSLSPDALTARAKTNKVNVIISPITQWDLFERNIVEWDAEDFKSIIWNLADPLLQNSSVFFISDEALMNKTGFEFTLGSIDEFVNYYEDNFNMGFFQPSDYIICMKEKQQIRIIHHAGVRIVIEKS